MFYVYPNDGSANTRSTFNAVSFSSFNMRVAMERERSHKNKIFIAFDNVVQVFIQTFFFFILLLNWPNSWWLLFEYSFTLSIGALLIAINIRFYNIIIIFITIDTIVRLFNDISSQNNDNISKHKFYEMNGYKWEWKKRE